MLAILVIVLLIGGFCLLFAALSENQSMRNSLMLVSFFSMLIYGFATTTLGEQNAKLPNVAGLCKGHLNLSWRVSQEDTNKILHALNGDAKCKLTAKVEPQPPAFSKR